MALGRRGMLNGITTFAVGLLTAGEVMAKECSTASVSECADEQVCWAIQTGAVGTAQEVEQLSSRIPEDYEFKINEIYAKAFTWTILQGYDPDTAFEMAKDAFSKDEADDWLSETVRNDYASHSFSMQERRNAADQFYDNVKGSLDLFEFGKFAANSEFPQNVTHFIDEARSRALICPPVSSKLDPSK